MIGGIHLLRATAAFLVLVYHIYYVSHIYVTNRVELFEFFYVGVDIFFVVSGFVMYYITSNGLARETLARYRCKFFADRFFRIVPLYWFFSICFFVVNNILYPEGSDKFLALDKLVKSLFFIPYGDGQSISPPVLGVGWTLNYEVLFYSVILFSMYMFKQVFFSVIGVLFFLFIMGYLYNDYNTYALYLSNPIVLEFIIGLLIGYIYVHYRGQMLFATLIFIIVAIVGWLSDFDLMGAHRLIVMGSFSGALVSIALLANDREILDFAVKNRFFYFLGSSSYIMYLCHHPVVSFLGKIFYRYGWFGNVVSFYIVSFIVVYVVSFGFEFVYNNCVKDKLRKT